MTTRRERLRAATVAEIKHAALKQIAEVGAPSLSLRGVAREIGMSPAGLYRYFDGRDGLLTALIVDAYNELADTVTEAVDKSTGLRSRFKAGINSYRQWSVTNKHQFLLIFGTPVPGYEAPADGPTVEANRRMGAQFFRIGLEAWRSDHFTGASTGGEVAAGERELANSLADDFPPELVRVMLGTWAHFHGLVTLEVLGQFDWVYGNSPEGFFDSEVERLLDSVGLTD